MNSGRLVRNQVVVAVADEERLTIHAKRPFRNQVGAVADEERLAIHEQNLEKQDPRSVQGVDHPLHPPTKC